MSELITEPTISNLPSGPVSQMSWEDRHRYYNPWMRLFARGFDFVVASWVFSFILGIMVDFLPKTLLTRWGTDLSAYSQVGHVHVVVDGVTAVGVLFILLLPICLWCLFVEPWLLSRWGYTPGKYLFNLKVAQLDGQLPNRKNAYGRSWRVWLHGCAAGVPILSLITNIKAYLRLKHMSATSWDENHFRVTHGKCGWVRKTVIFILFILPIGIWLIALAVLIAQGLAST